MTYSGESVCLVFAGKADETSRKEIIKTENPRVVHIDRYLTEAEYRVLLNISTVVLLPYSNRGSSGVVLESLAHGKNVIITKSRIWMNAKNYCSGLLHVVPLDVVQVSKEVQSILQSKQIEKSIILSGVARSNVIQFLAKDDIEVK
jgi:glycosyltransferase involved in cell wall biosynthesis